MIRLFQTLFLHFRNSDILSKISIVLTGTVIAQAILIGSVPFFSRMFSVSQFGELGFFMLISMFGTQLFSWRYDYGIASAENDQTATSLVALCMVIGLVSSLIFSVSLYLLYYLFQAKLAISKIDYLPWLLLYTYAYAIWNAVSFYNIRASRFKLNAILNITRAFATVAFSVLLYFIISGNGMIIGLALGQVIATVALGYFSLAKNHDIFFSSTHFNKISLLKTARKSSGLMKYSLPSAAVELTSGQLPQYFIGFFGTLVFGWFSQANRLLNAPLDLIGQSVRAVFWETAGKLYRDTGSCIGIFDKLSIRLLLISLVPFTLLFFTAPFLFSWVLGPQWEMAGYYSRLLIPLCFFRFISNPLSSMFYIASKQHYDFWLQVVVLMGVILVFFVKPFGRMGPETAIFLYSIIYSGKYIAEFLFSRHFALGQAQKNNK
jgi:O-antigen/teichoic acid export membrane protein